jgi:hypothetical protein
MSSRSSTPKPAIGWREWIGLPELGIKRIKVKVDTGARSSAIHASNVDFFARGGQQWVRFDVHPKQRDTRTTVHAEAPLIARRSVRNSGGRSERRIVIRTSMRFLDDEWPIELTLTDRDSMGFRMLLGREAIRGRFAVDPGRSFVGPRPPRKKKAAKPPLKKKKKKKYSRSKE